MDQFKNRRSGHRGAATKLITSVDQALSQETVCDIDLRSKSTELKKQKNTLENLDNEILNLMTDPDLMAEDIDEASARRLSLNVAIEKIEKFLKSKNTPPAQAQPHTHTPDTNKTEHSNGAFNVKLPVLPLVKFNGDPLLWFSFYDMFNEAVDSRVNISNVQKFQYLYTHLEGQAQKLLSGFQLTNENYIQAKQLLEKTYGNEKLIIRSHVHAILDIPSPNESANDLKDFRATYESHMRCLKALKVDVDGASHVYTAILTRKLPRKIQDNINRSTKNNFLDLTELQDAISEEIERLEIVSPHDPSPKPNQSSHYASSSNTSTYSNKTNKSYPYKQHGTVTSFQATTNTRVRCCHFCKQQDHDSINCKQYETPQKRRDQVNQAQLCFNCLSDRHHLKTCRSPFSCRICHNRHHTSICYKTDTTSPNTTNQNAQSTNGQQTNTHVATVTQSSTITQSAVTNTGNTILPTALLPVQSNDGHTYYLKTLFDSGSQKTFLLQSTARELNLENNGKVKLIINGFNTDGIMREYDTVSITSQTNDGPVNLQAIIIDKLPSRVDMRGRSEIINRLKSQGYELADPRSDNTTSLQMIIGADQSAKLLYTELSDHNIALTPSRVGYLVTGSTTFAGQTTISEAESSSSFRDPAVTSLHVSTEESIDNDVSRLWTLESIGIYTDSVSADDVATMCDFEANLSYDVDGNRYTARLPWKPSHAVLPDNYGLAHSRLSQSLVRLRKSPETLHHYDAIIHDYLARDFIEKVDVHAPTNPRSKVHYLPHHAVRKDSPTTPIRLVFDASARSANSPSLNDCLYRGPSLIQELGMLLLLFRQHPYACCSDIQKAYHIIRLDSDDSDSCRFLWPQDPYDPASPLDTYRFKCVIFGCICSQFLLNATLKHHLEHIENPVAESIAKHIYVDNILHTCDTEEEIIRFYQESNEIMMKANFRLYQWTSNSPLLNQIIETKGDGADSQTPMVNVLGLRWDPKTDMMGYAVHSPPSNPPRVTKRHIVSQCGKIFDPIGLMSPVTIRAKMFIQEVWKSKIDWDDELEPDQITKWSQIAEDLHTATNVTYPRKLKINSHSEIHTFNDASMSAYGSVLYIVTDGEAQILISKTRVTPIKSPTLPQLELTAASIGARLTDYVIRTYADLNPNNVFMWSDSEIVLRWLVSTKPLVNYVQNRVDEINNLLPNAHWNHVSSGDNPSDLVSRGMTARAYLKSKLWWSGPEWLTTRENWPTSNIVNNPGISENADDEIVVNPVISQPVLLPVIEVNRYSNLPKLIRINAYVHRFIHNVKSRVQKSQEAISTELTQEEIFNSEASLIKQAQRQAYPDEITYLESHGPNKSPNLIKQLRLQLVNGILRCSGRIHNANLPYDTRFPILLPPNSHLTKLFITRAHSEISHSGCNDTLTHIRQRFWIPAGRQKIKAQLRNCHSCKILQSAPFRVPISPPLPKVRVSECPPFTVTGIDYMGPLNVIDEGKMRKMWIALFTCANTRAIHLETVDNNTSIAFLHAFRRFASRRSCPRYVISDNASTFNAAEKLLHKLSTEPAVKTELLNKGIYWHHIAARAPWFGGFYERLVGITKSLLKRTIGRQLITPEELITLLAEIELNINNRPITYTSNDLDEPLPLSPSHLLHGRTLKSVAEQIKIEPNPSPTRDNLIKQFNTNTKLASEFNNRWLHEYLTTLRQYDKSHKSIDSRAEVKIGTVVQIHDDAPRLTWKLGRIIDVRRGADNQIRSVVLKTANGETTRPIAKLYPLEYSDGVIDPMIDLIDPTSDITDTISDQNAVIEDKSHPNALDESQSDQIRPTDDVASVDDSQEPSTSTNPRPTNPAIDSVHDTTDLQTATDASTVDTTHVDKKKQVKQNANSSIPANAPNMNARIPSARTSAMRARNRIRDWCQ